MNYSVEDGFPYYIQCLGDQDYIKVFKTCETILLLKSLTEEQAAFRYAPGKWSIKQIAGHLTDHERIMVYRCLTFSRRDTTLLPGYDQNLFVENGRFDELPLELLIHEFENVRASTLSFISSLSAEQLSLPGKAWRYEMSVEEFLKSTAGHELHHLSVLRSRYLAAGA